MWKCRLQNRSHFDQANHHGSVISRRQATVWNHYGLSPIGQELPDRYTMPRTWTKCNENDGSRYSSERSRALVRLVSNQSASTTKVTQHIHSFPDAFLQQMYILYICIFCLKCFDTFPRTSVRKWKIDVVACEQFTFHILNLQTDAYIYLYIYIYIRVCLCVCVRVINSIIRYR